MQALNIHAAYRSYLEAEPDRVLSVFSAEQYADEMAKSGEWVEDDGDYYLPEVWATQYDEGDNYTGPTYPEYDD